MGEPLFGPAPFVAIVFGAEVDTAAVAVVFAAGDAIGDAAALGAVAIVGMHVRHVVGAELVHETNVIGVAAQDPGILPGGEDGEGVGARAWAGAGSLRKAGAGVLQETAAKEGGGSEGTEAGILALPPPTGLIVMGNEEPILYRIFIQESLPRIAKRVSGLARDAKVIGEGLADGLEGRIAEGGVRFLVQVAGQRHDGETRVRGVPKGTAAVVGDKISGGCHPCIEMGGADAGLVAVIIAVRGDPQFGSSHEGAIVIDDILFPIIVVFCVIDDEVSIAPASGVEVLLRGVVAAFPPAGDTRQCGDGHAAAFAEGALVFIGSDTVRV